MAGDAVVPIKVIAPGRGGIRGAVVECWRSRELLGFLAWRDVSVRYKQMLFGALWAVIQPILTMMVFTLIFSKVAGLRAPDGLPYPVFVFAALLPWQLFHNSLMRSSESVVAESRLLTKVYFPRLLIPFSSVASGLVDFAVSLLVLIVMMACYGVSPGWSIILLPVFTVLAVVSALAVGLWLAPMNAVYRDFRYMVPFVLSLWLFITPVAYPASIVVDRLPVGWAWVYSTNPVAGVVEGFRWSLLGRSSMDPWMLLASSAGVIVLFLGGLAFFRRMERVFIDLL